MRKSARILEQYSKNKNEIQIDTESSSGSLSDTDEYCPPMKKIRSQHSQGQQGLSDYEKMIQANIAERRQFLAELDINEAKFSLQELKPPKKSTYRNKIKKILREPTKMRRSLRLQNQEVDVDDSALSFERKENVIETLVEERESLPDPGPKQLQSYYKCSDCHVSSNFIDSLKELKVKNSGHSWSSETKIVKMALNAMVNNETLVAKVIPSRIYSIKVHPTTDKTLVFVGGKLGELGIWDVQQKQKNDDVFFYNIHSRPINCMSIDKFEHRNLHTNSYDGSLRRLDLSSSIVEEIYRCNEDYYVSWHAQKDAHSFVVSGSYGFVDCVDVRSKTAVKHYRFGDNKSVKVVAIHPEKNHLMATGSSDGSIRLWDLRQMTKSPVSQINHSRTVSGLEFSPHSGNVLLSTCADNHLWLMKMESGTLEVTNKIRHNNHTGRWLTTFKASWLPGSENHFVVGSMDHRRKIEIWDANGSKVHNFQSESLQSVSSVNSFHPHKRVLAGGNSSGRVFIFLDKTNS